MCGIVGAYRTPITAGLEAIAHRGPDGLREQVTGDWHFGHALLAIISPGSTNQQPLRWGPITVILNGEIWNYRELRAELKEQGCVFATTGDAEVLAALYARHGEACFLMIEGMFAGAIYDDRDGMLTLVRDRFGEIPLHYLPAAPFAFASEIKAIKALGLPANETLRLPPGCIARLDGERVIVHPYYPIRKQDSLLPQSAPEETLLTLLEEGVRERTLGDKPICTTLSGGIDSTAIAYFLRQFIPALEAYIAVYDTGSDDLAAARRAAAALGITLHEIRVPEPTRADLDEIVRIIEMPHKAQVEIAWPCYFLGRQMQRDGFRIVFNGDGSDELWASYRFAQRKLDAGREDWHVFRQGLFLKQENKNFARANKIFMHHGIEPRQPFLHRPLVEFALSLDQMSVEGPGGKPKDIMRRAFTGLLPGDLASREKESFQRGIGLEPYLRDNFGDTRKLYLDAYRSIYDATL